MKRIVIDPEKFGETLHNSCPFIRFAFICGIIPGNNSDLPKTIDLAVYLDGSTDEYLAIEVILPLLIQCFPGSHCELTLLNYSDPVTRQRTIKTNPLFVRKGSESFFSQFVRQTSLDYRIMMAQYRRRGLPGSGEYPDLEAKVSRARKDDENSIQI